MSKSVEVIFVILFGLGYFLSPTVLIWGWLRWVSQPRARSVPSVLSSIGFVLGSTSALLAVLSIGYAFIHGFAYYDPLLLRIFRWGLLLSLSGALFGVGGLWRRSPFRWHAPLLAIGTFAFWILGVEGE